MWIFCGGMIRGGSTVQYQLVAGLVERFNRGNGLGWKAPSELDPFVKTTIPMDRWLVLKTHVCTSMVRELSRMPGGMGAKSFYIYRDLRDVVVSLRLKLGQSFEEVFTSADFNNTIKQSAVWEALPGCLFFRYEDYYDKWYAMALKVGKHLNLDVPPKIAIAVGMRLRIQSQQLKIDDIQKGQPYHPTALLHRRHISPTKGRPGAWREYLTEAQVRIIEDVHGGWLKKHEYEIGEK